MGGLGARSAVSLEGQILCSSFFAWGRDLYASPAYLGVAGGVNGVGWRVEGANMNVHSLCKALVPCTLL